MRLDIVKFILASFLVTLKLPRTYVFVTPTKMRHRSMQNLDAAHVRWGKIDTCRIVLGETILTEFIRTA